MFPKKEIKFLQPFVEFDACVEFEVVEFDPRLEIKETGKVLPLADCDKIYGLSPAHQLLFNKWYEEKLDWDKEHCK